MTTLTQYKELFGVLATGIAGFGILYSKQSSSVQEMIRLEERNEDSRVKREERYEDGRVRTDERNEDKMNAIKNQARDDLLKNQDLAREAAKIAHKEVMTARKEFRDEMNRLLGGKFVAEDNEKTD